MRAKLPYSALLPLWEVPALKSDAELSTFAKKLHGKWKSGQLGGETMPEDLHPPLPKQSDALAAYFTLGMSLNYQRNSYALWEACTNAFNDQSTKWVFDPIAAGDADPVRLAEALVKHRVALQPNRHPRIWQGNAKAIAALAAGSVKTLFEMSDYDLGNMMRFLQENKARFPYLSGPKISNYWLYVMYQYMDWPIRNHAALSIAPDTHVMSASVRLGVVPDDSNPSALATATASRWARILEGTGFLPIDLHTPLWLWSRAGFPAID